MHDRAAYFSPDYATARQRFRGAVQRAGARLHVLKLDTAAPDGAPLSIDIGWLGAADARSAVLHLSGVHGVEGFAGAAIQLAMLSRVPQLAQGCALILIHVLNPYGMAWLRRANPNNVDLNRNCLVEGEWSGATPIYRRLNRLLNPASPPRWDAFHLRAALSVARHGFRRVQQAVAEGQYAFPDGLFYGGDSLQPESALCRDWLQRHMGAVGSVFAIDAHTGLGRYGAASLFLETPAAVTRDDALLRRWRSAIGATPAEAQGGYSVRGAVLTALGAWLPRARVFAVTQEFGTYAPLRVLHALREENRWHCHGGGGIDHPTQRRLREALCPDDAEWRRRVIDQGVGLLHRALELGHAGVEQA